MNTTPIIGEAVGIQYQGITDQSESSPSTRLVSGVIIGDFSRGRVDRPMLINRDSLVRLGDKAKAAYQVVADCLNAGVPSVWAMRVGGEAVPAVCAPTSLNIPSIMVDNVVNLHYRVDYGNVTGAIEVYEIDAFETNSRNVIDDLFVNSLGGLSGLVVGGGGGVSPFQSLGFAVNGGNDADSSWTGDLPVTIHLLTFSDAGFSGGYDFVADVFGGSVSVHACSANNWAGF